MFGIGWNILQSKGNIIAPIVFIPAKKFHLKLSICPCWSFVREGLHTLNDSRVEIRGSVTIELEPLFDTGFS